MTGSAVEPTEKTRLVTQLSQHSQTSFTVWRNFYKVHHFPSQTFHRLGMFFFQLKTLILHYYTVTLPVTRIYLLHKKELPIELKPVLWIRIRNTDLDPHMQILVKMEAKDVRFKILGNYQFRDSTD